MHWRHSHQRSLSTLFVWKSACPTFYICIRQSQAACRVCRVSICWIYAENCITGQNYRRYHAHVSVLCVKWKHNNFNLTRFETFVVSIWCTGDVLYRLCNSSIMFSEHVHAKPFHCHVIMISLTGCYHASQACFDVLTNINMQGICRRSSRQFSAANHFT